MDTRTNPAPADQNQPVVDLDQVRGASRFGVLGYEEYVAAVVAASNRLFNARGGK